jgi:MoxR-like ATPase
VRSRHRIDISTVYDRAKELPDTRRIEVADIEPIPLRDPPTELREREPYLVGPELAEAVNLAIALGRPLLLQGDPGSGKTRLAYAIAYSLGLPLEQGYIKSTSRAQDLLYTYDAVARLYEAQLHSDSGEPDTTGRPSDAGNYVRLGPLGRAIARAAYGRRSVVLIDEIDKADIDFPNDLLRELDRLEFEAPEAPRLAWAVPDDRPDLRPIIFVTNNEEKALPAAFLRRCIFHYVEFPEDKDYLSKILGIHDVVDSRLRDEAIKVLVRLRELDLRKKPGLSELLDWVGYLQAVRTPVDELSALPYIGALLKEFADQQRAVEELKMR